MTSQSHALSRAGPAKISGEPGRGSGGAGAGGERQGFPGEASLAGLEPAAQHEEGTPKGTRASCSRRGCGREGLTLSGILSYASPPPYRVCGL